MKDRIFLSVWMVPDWQRGCVTVSIWRSEWSVILAPFPHCVLPRQRADSCESVWELFPDGRSEFVRGAQLHAKYMPCRMDDPLCVAAFVAANVPAQKRTL